MMTPRPNATHLSQLCLSPKSNLRGNMNCAPHDAHRHSVWAVISVARASTLLLPHAGQVGRAEASTAMGGHPTD